MQRLFLVDSFSDRPFTGNPAAVCPLDRPAEPSWMQSVAMEMNQAETAFYWPEGDEFGLRWFTPNVEVDLCGHATLAAAHIIALPEIRFKTKSGVLTTHQLGDKISMDFPRESPEPHDLPIHLNHALWTGKNRLFWFAELDSAQRVRDFEPELSLISTFGLVGFLITARSDNQEYDFVSRFFAPQSGIPEDPVTGGAHCALAPYWGEKLGKAELTGYQASPRGGFVGVRTAGDRVILSGQARTVFSGELFC
ncbi:MAG: PhzF family phenazine biosynthesis protein [Fimbriimonadaceae bacterium]